MTRLLFRPSLAAPGISASPSEDNLRYFNVMVLGPAQSPYEGTPLFVSSRYPLRTRRADAYRECSAQTSH